MTAPTEIHLKDYRPLLHLVDHTALTFELLAEHEVLVHSTLSVRPNPAAESSTFMQLDGAPAEAPEGAETPVMELVSLQIDGQDWQAFDRKGEVLTLRDVPSKPFTLSITTRINPAANKALSGLYTSGGKFTTQCEAHGFRNITFYPDRPDCLSRFTTTIIAEKGKYAQMLSNGNPSDRITLNDGRESITWEDPYPKPCYLFALVAGNLEAIHDSFTTMSGRKVALVIYTDKGDSAKAEHAMLSLKQSMAWDEQRFGREYDLDLFQIVAVGDFNFGAMENKGLNIFNSQAILADPHTATDTRYNYIQAVVGHEYFHNWSGNRVTCRDWFQLSLKEGFTVFRDAEFTADLNSRPVKRIDDVLDMRTVQFPEDASAMAHPIRPASVGSIENFYTPTVYEKGSEVIRMMHTMLGEETFRKGSDLYFSRHDGQAVTTEDFVAAMQDASNASANPVDLTQFQRTWYNQAGTPTLTVKDEYDATAKEYHLTVKQHTPPTAGQPVKEPFHIPLKLGLLGAKGQEITLALTPAQSASLQGDVLHLRKAEERFTFVNVAEKPLPSLLRNWSAPVKLRYNYSHKQLAFLMRHDTDGFNRYEAGQQLMLELLRERVDQYCHSEATPKNLPLRNKNDGDPSLTFRMTDSLSLLTEAFAAVLADTSLDNALAARSLSLPSSTYLAESYPDGQVNPEAIYAAIKGLQQDLGRALEQPLLERFKQSRNTESRPYAWNHADAGERAMKHVCLSYLVAAAPETYLQEAKALFDLHHNMTDTRAAFRLILDEGEPALRAEVTEAFFARYRHNPLALVQWFTDQALADHADALAQVKQLTTHSHYDNKNPNNIRALVGAFTSNMVHFHAIDGSGYQFLADEIIRIDRFNPMAAAGLTKRLATAHRYDAKRQALMEQALERIMQGTASANVHEIAGKTLEMLQGKKAAA